MSSATAELPRHPWNESFTWRVGEPPFQQLSEAQVEQFDRDGFVVVPDAFDVDRLARVIAEIDEAIATVDALLEQREDGRLSIAESGAITFAPHLVAGSSPLRRFAVDPFFTGACRDLIGPDVNLYWDQAVYKKHQKPRRFPWHQDNGYSYVEPQQYLTCWLALTDATADNGCPRVWPGVHRLGTLAHTYVDPLGFELEQTPDPDDVVVAEVPAGGVVLFSSLTPHLTGPNHTDEVRKAYILQYAPAGAEVLVGQPPEPPTSGQPADAPDRQFPVLRNGQPVVTG